METSGSFCSLSVCTTIWRNWSQPVHGVTGIFWQCMTHDSKWTSHGTLINTSGSSTVHSALVSPVHIHFPMLVTCQHHCCSMWMANTFWFIPWPEWDDVKHMDGCYKYPMGSRECTKTLMSTNVDSNGGDIAMYLGLKWSQKVGGWVNKINYINEPWHQSLAQEAWTGRAPLPLIQKKETEVSLMRLLCALGWSCCMHWVTVVASMTVASVCAPHWPWAPLHSAHVIGSH